MSSAFSDVLGSSPQSDSERERTSVHYDLSEKDDWQTPPELINDIESAVNIDIDPCSHEKTSHGDVNLRLEDGDDGLEDSWVESAKTDYPTAFVNPPFSYKKDWLQKAVEAVKNGVETVIFITPDGTDTKSWWHKYIAEYATYCCFCKGRVTYLDDGEETGTPPFGTVITIFGSCPDELLDVLQDWGHVVETV